MLRPYDLLENVLTDVEDGIRKGINVDILARKYSLSYRHLQRLFKFSFKQTLANYIRTRRLVESLHDLLGKEKKLVDIAIEYGFGYEQAYIRAFKREYGITPGQLRKSRHLVKAKLPLYLFERNKFPNGLFTVHFLDKVL
jgi:AraC family transcriptional regulator